MESQATAKVIYREIRTGLRPALLSMCTASFLVIPLLLVPPFHKLNVLAPLSGVLAVAGIMGWFGGFSRGALLTVLLTLGLTVSSQLPWLIEARPVAALSLFAGFAILGTASGANRASPILGLLASLAAWPVIKVPSLVLIPLVTMIAATALAWSGDILQKETARLAPTVSKNVRPLVSYGVAAAIIITIYAFWHRAVSTVYEPAFEVDYTLAEQGALSIQEAFYQSILVFATVGPPYKPLNAPAQVIVAFESLTSVLLFATYLGLMIHSLNKENH